MTNVVRLPGSVDPPGSDTEPRTALRRGGRLLARLLAALLVLGAGFAAVVLALGLAGGGAFLWIAPGAAFVGPAPEGVPGLVAFGALPSPTRWAYAATFAMNTAPVLAVLAELRLLMLSYAAGAAFDAGHAGRLRRIGLWLVAYAVAPAVGHGVVLLAGNGVDLDWLHASSLQSLVLAALAVTLAEVARAGHAVEADRDGFV